MCMLVCEYNNICFVLGSRAFFFSLSLSHTHTKSYTLKPSLDPLRVSESQNPEDVDTHPQT